MEVKIIVLFCLVGLTLQMSNSECEVAGCAACTMPSVCDACSENYQLHTIEGSEVTACIRETCPQNCLDCNQANQCKTCDDGFLLASNGECTSEEQSASTYSKIRILQAGNYSGGNQTKGNFSNCTIKGCEVCQSATRCSRCSLKYQLTNTGTCMSCNVLNCVVCTAAGVCSECSKNIPNLKPSPNGGACVVCNKNLTNMAGCDKCIRDNQCGLCMNGLQLFTKETMGVCVTCNIKNCKSCGLSALNSTSTVCTNCAVGYSPNPARDQCVQCLLPCVSCNGNAGPNNCATCDFPAFFPLANTNGTCIKNFIQGCILPNSNNYSLCAVCAPGFNLNAEGTKCGWNCPLNCMACSNATTCTTCEKGFYVDANQNCSKCNTRGCSTCSSNGATCTNCLRGFYLIGLECKACPGFCADCTSNTTCNEITQSNKQVLLIINGQSMLAVCESTCISCSNLNPSVCLECIEGQYLSNGKCKKCGGSCKTCSDVDKTQCLTCYPNTFLSGTSCVSCNSNCMTCVDSASPANCTSCRDGFYLNNFKCQKGCPKNCFTCSNLTTCTQCLSGYTVFTQKNSTNIICAPCMSSCRTCAEGKPSTCLTCGEGFYLAGTVCKPCSRNCAECTSAGCTTCSTGFFITSEQTCGQNCILPCATCGSSNPESCLSCIAGYSFNDITKACVQITSCDGGCIVCPMGYSLKEDGTCQACNTLKCQACNVDNLNECYSCKAASYLSDAGVCESCPVQCKTCLSATGCLSCAKGYTEQQNSAATAAGIECVKCNSPCATCMNTPDYCTSCLDGFDFFGWKCAQKFRFTFGMTLTVNLTTFEANYFTLIEKFASAIGANDTNAITINKITQGSVIIDGSAAPSGAAGSSDAAAQLAGLTNLVNSGDVAGMAIGTVSLTVEDGQVGTLVTDNKTLNVLAIVLGICIPIGVLIIIGIIVFVVYKKKKANQVKDFDIEEEKKKNAFNVTNDKIKV